MTSSRSQTRGWATTSTSFLWYVLNVGGSPLRGGRFPAYVLYHTDFSSSRKEAIKRGLLYSSDEGQIRELMAAEIDSSVKKVWEEVRGCGRMPAAFFARQSFNWCELLKDIYACVVYTGISGQGAEQVPYS